MSYVNMILTGTDQAMAKNVKRFDGSESWVGRHIISGFFEKLTPFSESQHEDVADPTDGHTLILN